MGALVIALVRRKLTWANLWNTVIETGHVTASILFLILGTAAVTALVVVLLGVRTFISDDQRLVPPVG